MASRGGRGSRARSKQRRAAERRSRKASMNAQYAKWREQGINSKSKRAKNNNRKQKKLVPRVPAPLHDQDVPFLVHTKLLQLAGYPDQWSSRHGAEIGQIIRDRYKSIEHAWESHNIVPVRSGVPEAYSADNWRA